MCREIRITSFLKSKQGLFAYDTAIFLAFAIMIKCISFINYITNIFIIKQRRLLVKVIFLRVV
ncbi:hypothetical protein LEQ41_07130 [Streptococcus agalactiae]|nr:hypothetical protein [Streptococcus agalactiae]